MAYRILLVDDEVHILRASEFKFQRLGYEVLCAADGEEAWELIAHARPDLIVTDCQMPRLDGLGLAARLQENPATADIPILMLTAKGFELSAEELRLRYGIAALLPKPFSPREMTQLAETLLNEKASTVAN